MNLLPLNQKVLDKFGPYTLITGISLILLGTAGIFLPGVMSLSTAIFVGWLLLIAGGFWAIHTYQYSRKHVMDWIKPTLLIIIGGLMLFYPAKGVEVVGVLLATYLLLDALGSFALAQTIHPAKGWGWMAFNGVISALLAILFLAGWPSTSFWMVGLYVGISLLFDGWALVVIGWKLRDEKNKSRL